jgi:alpha-aminoadipate carrier protein LysW|tara:strand:- start:207 stop:383 length:177 start_codon:yes stop_codon:yes gene_type:complete
LKKSECVECAGEIEFQDDVTIGEIVSCPDCGMEFEVSAVTGNKIEMKQAEKVGEDWGE